MSVGFRKSLLGFNTSDVLNYIENMHSTFKKREDTLNSEVEKLSSDLSLSKESYESLLSEKNEIAQRLNEFEEKYAEIQRLSDIICKLYMIAQANAKAIMERTGESSRITSDEIAKNISAIDEAHSSLNTLKAKLLETSDGFLKEIESLCTSLEVTKQQISENNLAVEDCKKEFENVYESLTNQ